MKKFLFMLGLYCLTGGILPAQQHISGKISDEASKAALAGASVRLQSTGKIVLSNDSGLFQLNGDRQNDTLWVSYVGYQQQQVPICQLDKLPVAIYLKSLGATLDEVEVNTGFYQVPKERATGSFTHIDNELLNRSTGYNILQRLEGIASGVQFTVAGSNDPADIRVRGVATIRSDETPLIVVDNFPYEGNLSDINPNDVLAVTVLKDAAAASIWGARAGNGVIVITTKQGGYNQRTKISVNSNVTIGAKPDLLYNQNRLPSEIVMQIEKEKYEQGGYYLADNNQTPFPEYVELLIQRDNGDISETDFLAQESLMKNTEVRKGALKYLYQPPVYQQYALNVSGGGTAYRYYFSAGYDKNLSEVIGNTNNRLNLNMTNTFNPLKGLELTAGIWYTPSESANNGLTIDDLGALNTSLIGISPYIRLADEQGTALPIVKDYRLAYLDQAANNGLLDWQYRPLDEIKLADNTAKANQLRLNGGIRYTFLTAFNINTTYQYIRDNSTSMNNYDHGSYFVRNMVNRFTQPDGSLVIPDKGILIGGIPSGSTSHSGRMQVNYTKAFEADHQVSALAGGEIRNQVQETYPGYTIYGYDDELLTGTAYYNYTQNYVIRPTGRSRITQPSAARSRFTDRYLSYFGNASYTYKDRYILSTSARWDGSNLFGVKTNQKGTPLWSVGGSWEVNKESFYHLGWLPYLRLRSTYGSSGNVNKNVSAYPTITHWGPDDISGLDNAAINSAGNPSLRWERVNTLNFGLDIYTKDQRINLNLDYYVKKASDLIGTDYLAPNTGIIKGGTASNTNLINYADLETKGLDLQLTTRNITGRFNWQSTLLLNYVKNRITHYSSDVTVDKYTYIYNPPPVIGKSRDVIYAYPWYGLDPETGYQLMYINGEKTTDYMSYVNSLGVDNLIEKGLTIPPLYGSFRNDFRWNNISFSFLLSWKSGYVFRRNSIAPGQEYDGSYHMDYFKRWQQPGDELKTNVPAKHEGALPWAADAYRDTEILITKGDHIRLQDISLSYSLSQKDFGKWPIQNLRLYAYARNLGIVWRANKQGIDPDYANGPYPAMRTVAFGIQADF